MFTGRMIGIDMPRVYDNVWQGDVRRVLCVCSANMLRSPTMQVVFSAEPFNYNTRSAGIYEFALVKVDEDLLQWADEIVCAEAEHFNYIMRRLESLNAKDKTVVNLAIPDTYAYRDPELVRLITQRYLDVTEGRPSVARIEVS